MCRKHTQAPSNQKHKRVASIDHRLGIDEAEATQLAKKIAEMRHKTKREVLADNDARLMLRVDSIRREKENRVGNPYGCETWYLTQDSVSNRAASLCFSSRRGMNYVMRPEFLINYIAYNPTNAQVRESLKTIFPSVLGVRLGSRLDKSTLTVCLKTSGKHTRAIRRGRVPLLLNTRMPLNQTGFGISPLSTR